MATTEEPTPIAAPDVPRIRSVARMPEPAPAVGEVVEEEPEAVETRKPRVVATDAPVEEAIIPLETPFGVAPDALAGTPVPGGEEPPTMGESEANSEALKRRDNEGRDNESSEPDQTTDDSPGPSTATPVPAAPPEVDAEPTPKKVKRTPSRDEDRQDNDD